MRKGAAYTRARRAHVTTYASPGSHDHITISVVTVEELHRQASEI